MTAEVALLNSEAAVLAADSAATITGSGQPKIYNSANKIFSLSMTEPVAVMVYNAGALGTVPWETVIKEHRSDLGSVPCATVADYSDRLLKYLTPFLQHAVPDCHLSHTIRVADLVLRRLWEQVMEGVSSAFSQGQPVSQDGARDLLTELVEQRIREFQQAGLTEDVSQSVVERQIDQAFPDLSTSIELRFGGLSPDDAFLLRVRELVGTALRSISPQEWSSGLVVVGFGRDEVFPSITEYRVCGPHANGVLTYFVSQDDIDEQSPALIQSFAQSDMVSTFMNGINPEFELVMRNMVGDVIGTLGDRVASLLGSASGSSSHLTDQLRNAQVELIQLFENRIQNYMWSNHSGLIVDVVASLPKEELAELAEALVNITSLRRRVTPVAETVGGPCDVAIISKGDGLVWAKRKHYFPPELNPRYFRRDESTWTRYAADQVAEGGKP